MNDGSQIILEEKELINGIYCGQDSSAYRRENYATLLGEVPIDRMEDKISLRWQQQTCNVASLYIRSSSITSIREGHERDFRRNGAELRRWGSIRKGRSQFQDKSKSIVRHYDVTLGGRRHVVAVFRQPFCSGEDSIREVV